MTQRPSLFFLNAGHFLDHYFLLIFPTAVLALHHAWGLDYGTALALGTPAFAAFAVGTLPAGWLGDRWSRTGMMAVFFIGIGTSSVATGFAQGPVTLMMGLGCLGLFAAIFHPVGLAMVTEATDRPGHALAVNGVFGNMGLAGAALATGLLTDQFGWRAAFVTPGLFSVALGLVYVRTLRAAARRGTDHETGRRTAPLFDATRSDRKRVIVLIGLSALFGGLIFNGVTVSLPKLFEERLADIMTNLSGIGATASLVFALAAFAQLPVGALLDRFGARPILLCVLAAQTTMLMAIGSLTGLTSAIVAAPLLLAIFGALPITGWLMARYVPSAWRARAFAMEYVLSLGVGSLAVPLISYLHTRGGFDTLYPLLAVGAVIVFAAACALPGRPKTAPAPIAAE